MLMPDLEISRSSTNTCTARWTIAVQILTPIGQRAKWRGKGLSIESEVPSMLLAAKMNRDIAVRAVTI